MPAHAHTICKKSVDLELFNCVGLPWNRVKDGSPYRLTLGCESNGKEKPAIIFVLSITLLRVNLRYRITTAITFLFLTQDNNTA